VLREEGQVYSQEEQEKVSLSMVFRILTPSLFTYPEIESSKNSKNKVCFREASYVGCGAALQ
jgi:hypothetical protein